MAECSATAFVEHSSAFRHCPNTGERLGTLLYSAEAFTCGPGLTPLSSGPYAGQILDGGFDEWRKVPQLHY